MSDDDSIPTSAAGYQPTLPKIDGAPDGTKIDASHPKFREAAEHARRAGLSQKQFSAFLGFEAQRVVASAKAAAGASKPAVAAPPAAAPARAAGKIEGYAKMTMAQKLAASGNI
jgi:hypothetical protein